MIRRIFAFAALSLVLVGAMAQEGGRPHFNPKEFRAMQERYIVKEAKLSKAEADVFFPIYREMKDKQREKASQALALKRNHPASNATDKDYSGVVGKIAELDAEVAKIEVEYYRKLCKAIPPKKVYSAILADDAFTRNMMQRLNAGGQRQKPRK